MTEALKPCPFCGGEAVANNYILEGAVRCQRCGATVTREHGRFDDLGFSEAIAAWNRRALAALPAPPEGEKGAG